MLHISVFFQDVYNHNVTSNSLFPDLDVLATSISYGKVISVPGISSEIQTILLYFERNMSKEEGP